MMPSSFIDLAAFALLFTAASGTMVKDAACQAKVDGLMADAIMANPCAASNTTCPTTCADAIASITAVCEGKNYEVSVDNKKMVKPFNEGKVELIFLMETFASGDACKKYLFDQGFAAATNCNMSFAFASKELVFSPWCATTTGGASETSCHASCQKTITNVFDRCKDGELYGNGAEKFESSVVGVALKLFGPETCDYNKPAKGSTAGSRYQAGHIFGSLLTVTLAFLTM